MPYIKRSERASYQGVLSELASLIPAERERRAGHLNYVISLLLEKVYGAEKRYVDHNEIMGLLSCVQREFYRRFTAPYEDKKIREEGDLTDL